MTVNGVGDAPNGGAKSPFFTTPWPWLLHASIWVGALSIVNASLPIIHLAGPLSALALVAALVSSRLLDPARLSVQIHDVLRFVLIDATFIGFGAGIVVPLLLLPARLAGARVGNNVQPIEIGVMAAAFVVQFYLLLAVAGTLHRRGSAAQRALLVSGCAAGAALVWSGWRDVADHLARNAEVASKIAAYEIETGKPGGTVSSEIALSLHGFYGRAENVAAATDGGIVAVGDFTFYGGHEAAGFARLSANGALLTSAAEAPGMLAGARRVRLLSGGALLLDLPEAREAFPGPWVLRTLRPDGTLEAQPGVVVGGRGTNAFESRVDPFDLDSAGRIVVGRSEAVAPGAEQPCVQRFLSDGTPDDEFNNRVGSALDSQAEGAARDCAVTEVLSLSGARVLVLLSLRNTGGAWVEGSLRRLAGDGSFDSTFAPPLTGVRKLASGENDAIYAATLTGTSPLAYALAKIGEDGALVTAFAPSPFLSLNALGVQRDGKVLVGGRVASKGPGDDVLRMLPDGRLDPQFGDGGRTPVNGFVHRIVESADGSIYVLGDFVAVGARANELPRYGIARLRPDGTPDPSFDPR